MISLDATKLLDRYVEELSARGLDGWEKIVVYKELARDIDDGYLRNSDISACWIGGNISYEFEASADAEIAVVNFFEKCSGEGDVWSALRLEIDRGGTYSSHFYYGSTPLLDGSYQEAERRVAQAD